MVNRFEIYLVNLDPTIGSEIKKTRPALVVSPNEMNHFLKTVIIAPMTSKTRNYPTRIDCHFADKEGQIVLDQIRAIDQTRLVRKLGSIDSKYEIPVTKILVEMFGR